MAGKRAAEVRWQDFVSWLKSLLNRNKIKPVKIEKPCVETVLTYYDRANPQKKSVEKAKITHRKHAQMALFARVQESKPRQYECPSQTTRIIAKFYS